MVNFVVRRSTRLSWSKNLSSSVNKLMSFFSSIYSRYAFDCTWNKNKKTMLNSCTKRERKVKKKNKQIELLTSCSVGHILCRISTLSSGNVFRSKQLTALMTLSTLMSILRRDMAGTIKENLYNTYFIK